MQRQQQIPKHGKLDHQTEQPLNKKIDYLNFLSPARIGTFNQLSRGGSGQL